VRPISLYEIICKVWTIINSKQIHHVLHEAGVIHGAQGGHRLDQGIIMISLLQVIYHISISKNLRKLAWMHMGESKGVEECCIEPDDDGLSFINTPLYVNTYAWYSYKDMFQEKCMVLEWIKSKNRHLHK
jgi:hypothetical protein